MTAGEGCGRQPCTAVCVLTCLCAPEEDFEKLPASTVPEMQRTNLAPVILQLKALGIDNVLRFSFLSVSPSNTMCVLCFEHCNLGFTQI